ncbi:MAG: BMP family ABC transporter substrate-binding protein [Clostridiales Family XIII bacterium]|nr:BMP family ABC transporter substrate-binding protein [Clostridiales Family XIII bacterium]
MKKIFTILLAVIMVFAFAACSNSGSDTSGSDTEATGESSGEAAADALTIGFIYIGTIDDGGYTQAQHSGTMALQEELGDKVHCIWKENVSDTNAQATQDATKQLLDQGATVIIGTSFGYGDPLFEMANSGQYDDIKFMHFSGGNINETNFGNYFGAMEEPRYLTGIIAGLQTESNKIGYVAAYPYTEVKIGINALALGAQSVNPDATVNVVYINSWYDPAQEKAAAETLLAQGCDVIAQHADTPGPQLAAASAGKLSIGYNLDNSGLEGLQDSFLTAPVWHHASYLVPTIQKILDGTWAPESYYGTMADGYVELSPLTKNVTDEAKAKVEEVQATIKDGSFKIFTGPIEDNEGNEVVPAGKSLDRGEIWATEYLVKGVTASE